MSGIGWDNGHNDELTKTFFAVIEDIRRLGELIIPRCYYSADPKDPITTVTLHAFSDGSKVAHGGCVYLKWHMHTFQGLKSLNREIFPFFLKKSGRRAGESGRCHPKNGRKIGRKSTCSELLIDVSQAHNAASDKYCDK